MGTFTVPFSVADRRRRRYQTVNALVDCGATYTILPAALLEGLGVVPHAVWRFVLADGSRVERGFGRTWMRLNGREDVSPVVFWDEGTEPVLGAVTLEVFSLGVDPVNGRLVPVGASCCWRLNLVSGLSWRIEMFGALLLMTIAAKWMIPLGQV